MTGVMRPLYREIITLGGRTVDVLLDGERVFLLAAGRPGRDVTDELPAEQVARLNAGHATLVRLDAIPYGEVDAEDVMRAADKERRARRGRRAA
jgi:hypothetical protein